MHVRKLGVTHMIFHFPPNLTHLPFQHFKTLAVDLFSLSFCLSPLPPTSPLLSVTFPFKENLSTKLWAYSKTVCQPSSTTTNNRNPPPKLFPANDTKTKIRTMTEHPHPQHGK